VSRRELEQLVTPPSAEHGNAVWRESAREPERLVADFVDVVVRFDSARATERATVCVHGDGDRDSIAGESASELEHDRSLAGAAERRAADSDDGGCRRQSHGPDRIGSFLPERRKREGGRRRQRAPLEQRGDTARERLANGGRHPAGVFVYGT
jgi:hypothetical protein